MDYNNDLSKSESCSSWETGAAPNSVNMNIRPPGRREPVESDENDPMSGSLLNNQVSCIDNSQVSCLDSQVSCIDNSQVPCIDNSQASCLDSQVSCIDNTAVGKDERGCCCPERNIPPERDPGGDPVVCVRIIPDDAEDPCEPPMECPYMPNRMGAIKVPPSPHPQLDMAVPYAGWGGARQKVLPNPKDKYQKYADCQAKILSTSARTFLAKSLNYRIEATSEAGYLKNWEGLAELMNKDFSYTQSLDSRVKDPTGALLMDWQTDRGSTIGKLVEHLYRLDRYDILDDKEFFKLIKRSVDNDNSRVKKADEDFKRQEKRKPHKPHITVDDVEGEMKRYSAFVCYEDGDEKFVMEMINELEIRDGHTLCLNARDLLIGHDNEQVVTAELIKSRCEKTIVVLSTRFVREDSEMCQFAMNVSHSLNPAARKSKIVPVMAEDCEIPPSLCHITPVDFTRSLERTWQWRKVSACLKTCHELLNYAEQVSLRRITLRAPHRTDLRASVRASMNAGALAAGTTIIGDTTTTITDKKKRQDDDTASLNGKSPSLTSSTSSSEGADDDNVDGTNGAIGPIPKNVDQMEKDKKKKKDKSREKKKNAKRNFHFSRFFRNQ